jgi:hypothetical protein
VPREARAALAVVLTTTTTGYGRHCNKAYSGRGW